MSDAREPSVEVRPVERAALLWDVPGLRGAGGSGQQWLKALRLDVTPRWDGTVAPEDQLVEGDAVSLAAHAVRAMVLGDEGASRRHGDTLRTLSPAGVLLGSAIDIALRDDPPAVRERALDAFDRVTAQLADRDLAARLSLRVAVWAQQLGDPQRARAALTRARWSTDRDHRLGSLVRRWLVAMGEEVEGVERFGGHKTPDDPLLSTPWIYADVLDATSRLTARRVESSLRGARDVQWSVGRTPFDDLQAAHAQAQWCADNELSRQLETLLAAEVIESDAHGSLQPWALRTWARLDRRGLQAVISRHERDLVGDRASRALQQTALDPTAMSRAYWSLANSLWDLLDDDQADQLLEIAVDEHPSGDAGDPGPRHVIGSMLLRLPERWMALAESTSDRLVRMVSCLDTSHLPAMPERLLELIALQAPEAASPPVRAAAAFHVSGQPVTDVGDWSGPQVAGLLIWREGSVTAGALASEVAQLFAISQRELLEAREQHSYSIGTFDVRTALGFLAAREASPSEEVAAHLLDVVQDPASSRDWQEGALEGLRAYAREHVLPETIARALYEWRATAGVSHLGDEALTDVFVRVSALNVVSDRLTAEDVTWLSVLMRSANARVRLQVAPTLCRAQTDRGATRAWTLISALFDPQDDVVIAVLAGLGAVEDIRFEPEALQVLTARLNELLDDGSRRVRQAVVHLVRHHRSLFGDERLRRASRDPSWLVRYEASLSDRAS